MKQKTFDFTTLHIEHLFPPLLTLRNISRKNTEGNPRWNMVQRFLLVACLRMFPNGVYQLSFEPSRSEDCCG